MFEADTDFLKEKKTVFIVTPTGRQDWFPYVRTSCVLAAGVTLLFWFDSKLGKCGRE